MRAIALLSVIGFVAASISSPQGWPARKEMVYQYTSQVLTGIPEINNQYAGMRLSTRVRVQSQPNSILVIKLENSKYKNFNEQLELYRGKYVLPSGEIEVPSSMKGHLETPFKVYHKRGIVERLEMESGEPEIITNIKKSIVSQLQLRLTPPSTQTTFGDNTITRQGPLGSKPSFKVMETSFIGECETSYTVNPLPAYLAQEFETRERLFTPFTGEKTTESGQYEEYPSRGQGEVSGDELCQGRQYYEVVKTKNLNKCTERPVFHLATGINPNCDNSENACMGGHSSVTSYIICGSQDDFLIRKVNTVNQHVTSAFGLQDSKEKLQASSRVTMELISVSTYSSPLQGPSSPKVKQSVLFELPSSDRYMSTESQRDKIQGQSSQGSLEFTQQSPKPDLRSSPQWYYHMSMSLPESKAQLSPVMEKIIRSSFQFTHSPSQSHETMKDIVVASAVIDVMGLSDLHNIEREIRSKFSSNVDEALKIWYEVVSMSGSNPSVMYIVEKAKESSLVGHGGSWLVSNVIRQVKTPTSELLQELVNLLKHHNVDRCPHLRSSATLQVTDLIYRACVDKTLSKTQFPVKIYGQFCSETSPVITNELIPFLKEKLRQSVNQDQHLVMTYVQALGNLGVEESTRELLNVVEGKLTRKSETRSLAVYNLWRSASTNPSAFRQVLLSLAMNSGENSEVRMAAITLLPYTKPSTSELQKLAIKTWFEPSHQVSSYISTTLKSLKHMEIQKTGFESIGEQAKLVYPLAKPVETGIQSSHNIHLRKIFKKLNIAVDGKLQYVMSRDSSLPKSFFTRVFLKGNSFTTADLGSTLHVQGVPTLLEKVNELFGMIRDYSPSTYSQMREQHYRQSVEEEIKNVAEQLNIKSHESKKPEAHLMLRLLGIQKLYSLDHQVIQQALRNVEESLNTSRDLLTQGLRGSFVKVINFLRSETSLPTESGLPLYVQIQTPGYIKAKTSIRAKGPSMTPSGTSGEFEVVVKPVINLESHVSVGIVCPFTNKILAGGVKSSLRMSTPVQMDVTLREGHITTVLKTPQDSESQTPHEVASFSIYPITVSMEARNIFHSTNPSEVTIISPSTTQPKRMTYPVGQLLGLGLDIQGKIATDYQHVDLPQLLMKTIQEPEVSVRLFSVELTYNPSTSQTKEVEVSTSMVFGQKSQTEINMHYPSYQMSQEVQKICSQYSSDQSQIQMCQQKPGWQIQNIESSIQQGCQEEKRSYIERQREVNQQKSQREIEQVAEQIFEKCKEERQLCRQEKQHCLETTSQSWSQSGSSQGYCQKKEQQCLNRYKSRQSLRKVLKQMVQGSALSVHLIASLNDQQGRQLSNIESQMAFGAHHATSTGGRHLIKVEGSYKPMSSSSQCSMQVDTSYNVRYPSTKWSREQILSENLRANFDVKGKYGCHGSFETFKVGMSASQSEEQKTYARESYEARKCQREESEGRKLTSACKQARHQASSVDRMEGQVYVPTWLVNHPVTRKVVLFFKSYTFPYLTETMGSTQMSSTQEQQIRFEGQVSPKGDKVQLKVFSNGYEGHLKNMPVGSYVSGLLPFCTKDSPLSRLHMKLTQNRRPTTCGLEGGKITTFDNVTYTYELNNCEHVVFQDRSVQPKVLVTTKKESGKQYVKVILEGKKYEWEVVGSPIRGSRQGMAKLMINGVEKTDLSAESYVNCESYVQRFDDGVYSVVSEKLGVEVLFDGERLEVKVYPYFLRNRGAGLCGDLNDEMVADMKSAGKCIMSSPRLAAYSYMLRGGQCQGVPQQDQARYQREQQTCIREEEVMTPVYEIYRDSKLSQQSGKRHVVELKRGQICISREMIRQCRGGQTPQYTRQIKVSYTCFPDTQKGQSLKSMAESGEYLTIVSYRPTDYSQTLMEPTHCTTQH